MPSSKKGGQKSRPLPVLHLDKLLKPNEARRRSTSTASSTDYVMDGITMTSAMELPFDIDDPSHDPVFSHEASEEGTKSGKSSSSVDTSKAPEKPTLTLQESAPDDGKKGEAEGDSDMDISDDESTSSTESEDSSVDIPVERKKPAAPSQTRELTENPKKSTLASSQSDEKARNEAKTTMATKERAVLAKPNTTSPSEPQVDRKASDKEVETMEVESTDNIPKQIVIGQHTDTRSTTEEAPRPSSKTSAADAKRKDSTKPSLGAKGPSKVSATEENGRDSTNQSSEAARSSETSASDKKGKDSDSTKQPPAKPSRKRSRDKENIGTANSMAAGSERAPLEQGRSTPALGETPRPRFYHDEERQLFDKVDRMILDDEWEELKNKIDLDILNAEEEDLLKRIDQSICAAEEASKPGGRVLYTARVMHDGSLKERYPSRAKDPLYPEEEPPRKRLKLGITPGDSSKSNVFDVEDLSLEVSRKAKIPKYDEKNARFLTREELRTKVVDPILAKEKCFVYPRKLTVSLNDSSDDPYSAVLRCQGHPDLVKQVEVQVTLLIRARQQAIGRYSQGTNGKSSPEALRHEALDDKEQTQNSVGDKDRKDIQSLKQQKNYNAYWEFDKTYKDVREIEFSGTGIHHQRVRKEMWGCHKEKFGNACGEDCPCPEHLPYLTSTVASSFIASKSKKEPKWKNDLAPLVGFSTSFASKFFQKLQEEHPNETPKQILARLVLMWKEHMRIKRFGVRCSEKCPCREGWDAIFKRGRLHASEIAEEKEKVKKTSSSLDRIPRRRLPNERASVAPSKATTNQRPLASQPAGRGSDGGRAKESASKSVAGRIPRRPSADQARNNASAPADASTSQLISFLNPPIAAKPASTARSSRLRPDAQTPSSSSSLGSKTTIARKSVASSQPQHYEVVFQPGETMGFFCENDNRQGAPVCKIASLNDTRSNDPRLQVGTVITDVTHEGGHVQPVRTYTDLKKHYDKAKKNGTPIRVRFMNSPASSLIGSLTSSAPEAKRGEWTEAGEWIGSSTKGWAGGARRLSEKESKTVVSTTKTSQGNEAEARRSPPPPNKVAALPRIQLGQSKLSQKAPTISLQYSTEMAPAKHRTLPKPPSILRKGVVRPEKPSLSNLPPGESTFKALAGTVSKRSVHFSKSGCERRFYEVETPSFRLASLVSSDPPPGATVSQEMAVGEPAKPKVLVTKDLIEAIRNKGFRDVIAVLQAGVSPSARDNSNKSPKDHVKERLEELKFELAHDPGNPELAKQVNDFEMKRKVLSIYLEAINTIDKARFNKEWNRFNVQVDRIKDVCLSVRGAEHEGSKVIECRTRIKGDEMSSLPPIPMQGTILHDWRNNESARGYSFNYNPHLSDPFRSDVEISLYKGERIDATPPILLGEVVFPFSRISASVVGKEEIVERLPPNEFVASCKVQLRASKEDKPVCRKAKTSEATNKLKEVIQWITQFNNDAAKLDGNGAALSGDIKAPGCCISLLHAATYLHEPDLAAQLLKLGADPAAPSDVGSARMLAQNLADRIKKSDEDEESNEVRLKSEKVRDIMKSDATAAHEDSTDPSTDATRLQEAQEDATRSALPRPQPATEAVGDVSGMPPYALLGQNKGEVDVLKTAAASMPPQSQLGSDTKTSVLGDSDRADVSTFALASMPPYSQLAGGNNGDAKMSSTLGDVSRAPSIKAESKQDKTVSLPVLDYWVDCREEKCRFFGRPGDGCRRGSDCHYLHIEPSIGFSLDNEQLDIDEESLMMLSLGIFRKAQQNQDGRTLYTAAYRNPVDNVLYKAEGGNYVGKGRGVCWYTTEEEAIVQLKRVVAFHQSRKHGIYGPLSSQSKRPRDDRDDPRAALGHTKRARRDSSGASPPSKSLFNRLMKCHGGLSAVHQQIFGVPLKKSDWSVRHRHGGFITAELISPLDPSCRYTPSQVGGGEFIDGEYWFKGEKNAKTSAFVSLLKSCIKYGNVNADCTMTKKGKRLSL